MKLSFHGATREVTGACYLLDTGTQKILIDCGLFQGAHECSMLNFDPLGFDPKSIDALIVTHAHLDHVGRIPKLVREGFSGKIYSTPPTRELARYVLEDALSLARREDKALYESADIEKTFLLWEEINYGKKVEIGDIAFIAHEAGHILGSAIIELSAEGKKFLFTGDLGNVPSVLLPPPHAPSGTEYLIIESTYGNRNHETAEERSLKLERAVEDVAGQGGTLLIPAFATERTQEVLHLLNEMLHFKRIPEVPVFVDSPLAAKVTFVYEKYPRYYREEIQKLYREHPHLFQFGELKFTQTVEESKKINTVPGPKVVIAGSGMMSGGRVLHHALRALPDPRSMLLIIGYQAAGSVGRRLLDGERKVKIYGEEVDVRAEVRKINGFSAHADNPQLFAFVETNRDSLKHVFVVHGEEAQALHLAQEVKDHLGVSADAPLPHQEFSL